ncbi:adenosine receptor A3-like [Nematostella vectensis]|uniref:adenosine receptor A3-like n=1 Tax=Nematostella vectensis TaxID=45351 RepID=UPI0020774629|nr:adenosine receptor A3-like [Nematostella vectensis]
MPNFSNTTVVVIKMVLYEVMATTGLVIFLANSLTLVTFYVHKNLIRRSGYFLLSVAVADTLIGLSALFTNTAKLTDSYHGLFRVFCRLFSQVSIASICGLIIVAIERLYATYFPFKHRCLQKRVFAAGIAIPWLLTLSISVTYIQEYTYQFAKKGKTAVSMAGLVVICAAYAAIFIKVKKQHVQHQQAALPRAQRRERELAKTLFIVTVLSLLCWLPDSVYHFVPYYDGKSVQHRVYQFLRLMNSMVNPLVYVCRMKEFRRTLGYLLRLVFCCRRNNFVAPNSETRTDKHTP